MAVLYFGSDEDLSGDGKVLNPAVYAAVSAPDAVFAAVRQKLGRRGGEEDDVEAGNGMGQDHDQKDATPGPSDDRNRPSPRPQRQGQALPTGENVPKWFKL